MRAVVGTLLGCLWCASLAYAVEGVQVARQSQTGMHREPVYPVQSRYVITTDTYVAQVDRDGALCSLVVKGQEFLAPPRLVGNAPRNMWTEPAMMACQERWSHFPFRLPGVKSHTDNVIRAENADWWLEYRFLPDSIEMAFQGAPDGSTSFGNGYPAAQIAFRLNNGLHRACDPGVQGELGWPVARPTEPGDYAVMAQNGACILFEGAQYLESRSEGADPPNWRHVLYTGSHARTDQPITRRLRLYKQAPLSNSLTVSVISPNPNHMFSQTEEVTFPVKLTAHYGQSLKGTLQFKGSPYIWQKPEIAAEIPVDLSAQVPSRTVQLTLKPPQPGHYTGEVIVTDGTGELCKTRLGSMFRPEEIAPVVPPPGFDEWWAKNMAELDKVPLDLTLEEQKDKENAKGRVYKVKYRSWEGRWAYAWLHVPKAEGKFPAKVVCPPVSAYQPGVAQPASGELSIYVAVHGGDISEPLPKCDFDYFRTGIESRETFMLRYSYCCLVRCFDIIQAHEKCNGEVHVTGSSQGAGLSLVLGGLRSPTTITGVAVALVRIDWTALGYTKWGPGPLPGLEVDPQLLAEELRYYDPACFARHIRAPLKIGMALFDWCAPAEGIFTAINALPPDTKCEVFIDPFAGHHTIDYSRMQGDLIEVPRWQGTAAENYARP
jgi:cephalosporin-C deacetylase-like acetyl esterase